MLLPFSKILEIFGKSWRYVFCVLVKAIKSLTSNTMDLLVCKVCKVYYLLVILKHSFHFQINPKHKSVKIKPKWQIKERTGTGTLFITHHVRLVVMNITTSFVHISLYHPQRDKKNLFDIFKNTEGKAWKFQQNRKELLPGYYIHNTTIIVPIWRHLFKPFVNEK